MTKESISNAVNKMRPKAQSFLSTYSAALVLCLCLIITALSSYFIHRTLRSEQEVRFTRLTDTIVEAIQSRLRVYENLLLATQGMFYSQNLITRQEFQRFVTELNLKERFPGIQAIGYTQKVPAAQRHKHEQFVRKEGFPGYKIWPETPVREVYFSVLYIEPFDWRNQRAFGFDMFTEDIRRKAMENARDSGLPHATEKVILVQETKQQQQNGFLIYVPHYDPKATITSVEDRRKYLKGFIYAPFRMGDLISEVARENPIQFQRTQITIYDGDIAQPEKFLYGSKPPEAIEAKVPPMNATFQRTSHVTIAGAIWTIEFNATKQFEAFTTWSFPFAIFVLGSIISLLIYSVLSFSTRLRNHLQSELAEREASQREILHARFEAENANRAKTLFLANMSHEIRTPLGVIVGFSDLALDKPNLEEEIRKFLRVIKRNAQQLVTLVGEVLDLSKIEANKLEVECVKFSLPDVLQEIVSSFEVRAQEKNVRLILDLKQKIPECLFSDPTKFRQILTNLIGNAVKFTPRGFIKVIPRLHSPPIKGTIMDFEIFIEDSGIGINPENSKKLFQPFSQADASMTRKYGGTGLGLILSKKLAQLLEGDVKLVKSEPGKGSVFSFRLKAGPFEEFWNPDHKPEEFKEINKPSELKPLSGQTILLVEDALDNQVLFSTYLKSSGADFDIAKDGIEALKKVEEKNYSLVLMDIQMPNMDGHEATARLRQNKFKKPIIALTAHAFQEEKSRALEGGFDDYLTKPVSRKELIKKIVSHLKDNYQ